MQSVKLRSVRYIWFDKRFWNCSLSFVNCAAWVVSFQAVQQLSQVACSGEPSLQNALELALRSLRMLPSHASREILILMGSLTTCDPGDISVTVQVSMSGLPEENLYVLLMRMKAFRTSNGMKSMWCPCDTWICMKCLWQALILRKSLSFLNINGVNKLSHLKNFLRFWNIPLGMVKINVLILSTKT